MDELKLLIRVKTGLLSIKLGEAEILLPVKDGITDDAGLLLKTLQIRIQEVIKMRQTAWQKNSNEYRKAKIAINNDIAYLNKELKKATKEQSCV